MATSRKQRKKPRKTSTARPRTSTLPVVGFAGVAPWEAWLLRNHARSSGIWMRLQRGARDAGGLTYAQAVEVALCFGWIDGQKKSLDAQHWLHLFTPRKANSMWSVINRTKALELMAQGRMHPAGLAAVERAQKNGTWDRAYDGQSAAEMPQDLRDALATNARAARTYAGLNARNRYAIFFRLQSVKRPETRARRLRDLLAMLARGESLYP